MPSFYYNKRTATTTWLMRERENSAKMSRWLHLPSTEPDTLGRPNSPSLSVTTTYSVSKIQWTTQDTQHKWKFCSLSENISILITLWDPRFRCMYCSWLINENVNPDTGDNEAPVPISGLWSALTSILSCLARVVVVRAYHGGIIDGTNSW